MTEPKTEIAHISTPKAHYTLDFGSGTIRVKPIITNADRIRAMSDEELAELFANDNCGYCRIHDFCFAKGCAMNCEDARLEWLKQEVSE